MIRALAAAAACLLAVPDSAGRPHARCSACGLYTEALCQIQHPEWTRDAVIYQINTRQFTPEGTFAAAQEQLRA